MCTIPRRNISQFLLTKYQHSTRRDRPGDTILGGVIDELAKKVSALVDVMTSAIEAPGTYHPTTNSKHPTLTRHIIIRE